MAPRDGFEPPTNGLTVRRSTTELPGNTHGVRRTRGSSYRRRAIVRNECGSVKKMGVLLVKKRPFLNQHLTVRLHGFTQRFVHAFERFGQRFHAACE